MDEKGWHMRKAKIICTIGPSSSSKAIISKMIKSGMDVARLNFSHGSYAEHEQVMKHIRSGERALNASVAVLQDLQGLKIRVGSIHKGSVMLRRGDVLSLTTKKVIGTSSELHVKYPALIKDVKVGDTVLMDDGLLQMVVIRKEAHKLLARVVEGGLLRENKGVNLPASKLSGMIFTKKDREDLELGIRLGIDYVAMSFVNSGKDVLKVKNWLREKN